MNEDDPATWPEQDGPPACPRCGGVHADVHKVAWDRGDGDDDYPREDES